MGVSRKTEIGTVNGTPKKRLFWSIIADYDLKTAICELIDNALDHWMNNGRKSDLLVEVGLDQDQQSVVVSDNAGGVASQDLEVLVAPGGSLNDASAPVVGVFGVGSKRAGVALGEVVEIRTRKGRGQSLGVDITPEWLATDDWDIAEYEVPELPPGTTEVTISRLRKRFDFSQIDALRNHLGETYDRFISNDCRVTLNGLGVQGTNFETWAFPPAYSPKSVTIDLDYGADGTVSAEIVGGLIRDRDPDRENYGVYFYCNDRLIVKEIKTRDVGYFVSSEAGVPHPDASLCRAIVRLNGPAKLMPWTSNKSGINFDHRVFEDIRPALVQLVSYFSKLSRRLKDDWQGQVYPYTSGTIDKILTEEASLGRRLHLVPLPKAHRSSVETLKSKNATKLKDEPWTLGLVEAIAAVDVLAKQKLQTGNRIALILLDSNFEIALKEFIVHRADLFPPKEFGDLRALFTDRTKVIEAVAKRKPELRMYLQRVSHYYLMRNKFIHERATTDITPADIENYRSVIEKVLEILFGLKFPKRGH